jgi:hypothetical protein
MNALNTTPWIITPGHCACRLVGRRSPVAVAIPPNRTVLPVNMLRSSAALSVNRRPSAAASRMTFDAVRYARSLPLSSFGDTWVIGSSSGVSSASMRSKRRAHSATSSWAGGLRWNALIESRFISFSVKTENMSRASRMFRATVLRDCDTPQTTVAGTICRLSRRAG